MTFSALLLSVSLAVSPPAPTGVGFPWRHAARPDTTTDTTFYITNRARRGQQLQRARADSLEYGLVVVRFVETPSSYIGDQFLRRLDTQITDSVRLSRDAFVRVLRDADQNSAATGDGTVLFVHGYATSFRRGIVQSSEVMHRGRFDGPLVLFSWPANRVLAKWPTPRALISGAYREDSAAAVASNGAFREALATVLSATRPGSLSVVGHSMGAQLVAEALRGPSAEHAALTTAPLHALIFFAPDISAARFRDSLAVPVAALAHRRVLYAAANDRLLSISRMVNHAPRVGQAGAARTLGADDIEVVDVTAGLRGDGLLRSIIDMHHAMRFAGTALYDFFGVLRGVPAECRDRDGVTARAGERLWRLTNAPIPATIGTCSLASASDIK